MEIASLLNKSSVIESNNAVLAISSGWGVDCHDSMGENSLLLQIYKSRYLSLSKKDNEHFIRLSASVAEFVENLEQYKKDKSILYSINGPDNSSYLVFVLESSSVILGCLFVKSQFNE